MDSEILPQECLKVMQRLFDFIDTKDVELNKKLNLIVNPEIIKILIKQVEHESIDVKVELYRTLSQLFESNPFNSLILYKKDQEISEFNHSILETIVHFVMTMECNDKIIDDLVQAIAPFTKFYPINCKTIKVILSILIKDFHEEKITHSLLRKSILIIKILLGQKSVPEEGPYTFFITYGDQGGLKVLNKNLKWPFSKGFHLYLKFYVEDFLDEEMSLWTLSLEQDDFVLLVNSEGELKVKLFSYDEVLTIGKLQKKTWILLTLHYTIKSKILRNVFELNCQVNGETFEKQDLPVPPISMTEEIVDMTLGRNFYGRINSAVLTRSQIIPYSNKMVMNTWKDIESFLVINKKNVRDIFAFYSPVLRANLNSKEIIYDISSQNHAEMSQNCGIYSNPFPEVDINYYGGLYTYLPFIHLLKFYEYDKFPEALTDIFELYLLFFKNKFGNIESEAINCAFFSISSQLINEINPKFIKPKTITLFSQMIQNLTDDFLLKEALTNFLFKLNLKKIEDTQVINSYFEIIETFFLQSFDWSYNLINIDTVFHYLIDNFEEERPQLCCHYHYSLSTKSKDENEVVTVNNNYTKKFSVIMRILKTIFISLPKSSSIKQSKSTIMELLFHNYSSCLKAVLLQTITEGVKIDPRYYMQEFSILHFAYKYLSIVELPEEIVSIFQILMACQIEDSQNWALRQNNIYRMSQSLKRIQSCRIQEKQQKINLRPQNKKRTRRPSSVDNNLHVIQGIQSGNRKGSALKTKVLPIQTNKVVYQTILKICFQFNSKQQQWLLKHDDYCLILQPYFTFCCLDFKKNLINMIRNTIVLSFAGKKISSAENQFDKLYKLLLNEFILKELDSSEDQQANTLSSEIIRNIYFIVDYTVINMREDWLHLYVYLLRLTGIMEEIKKDIIIKNGVEEEKAELAVKMAYRKLVLRVVKLAEKNVFNMSKLIFIVSLVVFGNQNRSPNSQLFQYFKSLEPFLLITTDSSCSPLKKSFLDSKLILQTISSFNLNEYQLTKMESSQQQKIILAFLDLEYTNEDSDLYENRFMYLIKAEFKQIKFSDNFIKDPFTKEEGESSTMATGQIISVLLCLCLEASAHNNNMPIFQDSLQSLLAFFQWFLLLSSRDGLKQFKHSERNIDVPKNIASSVLHFLYNMLNLPFSEQCKKLIQNCLYHIFRFVSLIVRCLYDKLAQPENFEKALERSIHHKSIEQYNFFIFQLFKQVLALKDMTSLPDTPKQKVMQLIHHPKVSGYFKNKMSFSIESKLQKAIFNHHQNLSEITKQIQFSFAISKEIQKQAKRSENLQKENEWEKEFKDEHLRKTNLDYRKTQRVWIKIWKRLRMYHYFWSVGMNQRESLELPFEKNHNLIYRHKFSKFLDKNGVRPVLEVQHVEPWHVKKMLMQKQFEYRNSNYLYHLHEETEYKKKQKSFLQKIVGKSSQNIFFVDWIKHNSKRKGYLSVQNQKMKFKYSSTYQKDSHLEFSSFILAQYKPVEKYWSLVQITNIMERRYLTKRQCLLIEFEDGTNLIFNFLNEDKEEFMKLIEARQNSVDKSTMVKLNQIGFYTKKFNITSLEGLDYATQLWKDYKISNFKYLMIVNKFAGRSYLDPANYPVFPWILSNFENPTSEYRNLSKTIGAIGSEQRRQFFRSKIEATDPFDPVPPYQYGTHYSSPGVVFNFLIRLQPYTQASRTLQGGKFDIPDRLFSSIITCWRSVASEVSDVRELTPQFFYLPEMLLNIDHHDFGMTQLKERVHNVQLPQWSSSAYDFIVKHRIQLESDYVSQQIGNWIDLVFGYKQKGKLAEENLNLFYYLTYEDSIELKNITDQQTRISKEAQIMHFGQTPTQLWTKPHGGRKNAKKISFFYKKISLIFSLQSPTPMSIIGYKEVNNLILFHNYSIIFCCQQNTYHVDHQIRILRNNSKQNIYFLEDIEFTRRVQIFNNLKYIAIASYINGDLLVFALPEGKKVEEKKGSQKSCILVNEKEDLMLVGSCNGLLEVYQIVYREKDSLTLVKIASEYYMSPIHSITEGGNYFCISSGSLVTLIRASRSLKYIYDKFKMRGVKMIRSLEMQRKVQECLISTDPLFCLVIITSLQLLSYSGNGQLLASKKAKLSFSPIKVTQNFMDHIVYVENNRLKVLSLPFLKQISDIQLPNKKFIEIRCVNNRIFLVTNYCEIITLEEHQE